jgi:hypothetical protein
MLLYVCYMYAICMLYVYIYVCFMCDLMYATQQKSSALSFFFKSYLLLLLLLVGFDLTTHKLQPPRWQSST